MVRKFLIFLIPLAVAGTLAGCTVANPEVSALTELVSFSAKSSSPFMQENLGNAIYFSGYCLPGVTGFEFRLNDAALWSAIPSTAPTPDSGEYLIGTPNYDVDCSDGEYDFYIFQSAAMENFDLNSLSPGPGDPASIELRTAGIEGLPVLRFTRPSPSAFEMYSSYYNYYGAVEENRDYIFTIRILDTSGHHAMIGSGSTLPMAITVENLSGVVLPTGEVYNSACAAPATAADTTFFPGTDEIILCYRAINGIENGDTARITISAPGMISYSHEVSIRAQNSAIGIISGFSGMLPGTLVKGVNYTMNMGIMPLFSNFWSRYISSYSGSFTISDSSNQVSFVRNGTDTDCSATALIGSMTCTSSVGQKAIIMNVPESYSGSSITLNVSATPIASCNSGCSIYQSGTNYNISSYIPKSQTINVVSSSKSYYGSKATLQGGEQVIRTGTCMMADISPSNMEGYILPASTTIAVVVTSANSYLEFFDSSTCSNSLGLYAPITFYVNELSKPVYFRVNTAPPSGIITLNVDDGVRTIPQQYYIKSDGGTP